MAKKNYYKMLGVSRTASPEEISAAKNRLAKKYHPDANMKDGIDTTKKMQRILEAYRILSDPKKRASYDRKVFGKPSSDSDRNFDLFNLHNNIEETENLTSPLWQEVTSLSKKDAMEEFMFLGLRKMEGVSETDFRNVFQKEMQEVYGLILQKMKEEGLMEQAGDNWRLTERGIDISNYVMSEFLF